MGTVPGRLPYPVILGSAPHAQSSPGAWLFASITALAMLFFQFINMFFLKAKHHLMSGVQGRGRQGTHVIMGKNKKACSCFLHG